MIDADIRKLSECEPDRPLDGLEADIWAGIAARAAARKGVRIVALCQTAVMAFAMVVSIAAGLVLATSSEPASASILRPPGMELAPSHLLFGTRQ